MKRSLCLLAMSTILCSAIGCGQKGGGQTVEDKKVDVVIISGQSNAVGCTHEEYLMETVGARYSEFLNGYPEIQIAFNSWTKNAPNGDWNNGPFTWEIQNKSRNDNFVKVALGQGNSVNTFGPEIGIAEELHEKYANKLFLIKLACGASNLKNDWTNRDSHMYPILIEYVKAQIKNLEKKGFKPTIKAFCWMQGEGDSWDGYWNVYQDNLRTFVGNMREDLAAFSGGKNIPFIDAGISNAPDWPKYQQVNAAKEAFAAESEDNYYFSTIDAGLHTNQEPYPNVDTAHYDSESQVQLGHMFAQAFEQFLEQPEE